MENINTRIMSVKSLSDSREIHSLLKETPIQLRMKLFGVNTEVVLSGAIEQYINIMQHMTRAFLGSNSC
jgi:hypothetical protein